MKLRNAMFIALGLSIMAPLYAADMKDVMEDRAEARHDAAKDQAERNYDVAKDNCKKNVRQCEGRLHEGCEGRLRRREGPGQGE